MRTDDRIKQLAGEFPGLTVGYVGNVGVGSRGPFDDRSWRVFLPHPGRVGGEWDSIYVTQQQAEECGDAEWAHIEKMIRFYWPKGGR